MAAVCNAAIGGRSKSHNCNAIERRNRQEYINTTALIEQEQLPRAHGQTSPPAKTGGKKAITPHLPS